MDRNNAIFDHWLAGETNTEIAKKSHLDRSAIDDVVANGRVSKVQQHSPTEQPPIYNVWNYGSCDPRFGQKHPGQMPGQALVNLLLWLTKPFAVVVDPMAGGGTTAKEEKSCIKQGNQSITLSKVQRLPNVKQGCIPSSHQSTTSGIMQVTTPGVNADWENC